ncbi:WD40 repeat domain-containing protein [Thioclava sp. FR2]|uniref:WD40 repeat domain-containing protein n=1 Tax=Thioclava sp. FR2 TaxID=3445780 RepID=UPI003EBCE427
MNGTDLTPWNAIGRKIAAHNSAELTAFHTGKTEAPNLAEDTRSPALAEAVLAEVIALNKAGKGGTARDIYDPAHAPFIPQMEREGHRGLSFCAVLDKNRFLVQQGTSWTANTTWLIDGDQIDKAPPLAAFAWSRNRQHFLSVLPDGSLTVAPRYGALPTDTIPALPGTAFVPPDLPANRVNYYPPPDDRAAYNQIAISDDGKTILLVCALRGICCLRKSAKGWQTELLYPSTLLGLIDDMDFWIDDGEIFSPSFKMIHAALSPDGRYVALGTQMSPHYILDLSDPTATGLHANLGNLSEYPHNASFDGTGAAIALNSCHFYNGVTFAADMAAVKGKSTVQWQKDPLQTILNDYLRVYASGWLPATMTQGHKGAFLLAGSSYATCVTPSGEVIWEIQFGSSAGGVDICPTTGRILIASHSGMLHLLDPSASASPPAMSGYNTPIERLRWVFWDYLPTPLIW